MVTTRLCSGAQPYHLTVPDGGIIAGMGQDQSGLPRIQTQGGDKAFTPYCCPPGTIRRLLIEPGGVVREGSLLTRATRGRATCPYKVGELEGSECAFSDMAV